MKSKIAIEFDKKLSNGEFDGLDYGQLDIGTLWTWIESKVNKAIKETRVEELEASKRFWDMKAQDVANSKIDTLVSKTVLAIFYANLEDRIAKLKEATPEEATKGFPAEQ